MGLPNIYLQHRVCPWIAGVADLWTHATDPASSPGAVSCYQVVRWVRSEVSEGYHKSNRPIWR